MTSVDALIARFSTMLLSQMATSFFINGAPGAGKSHLLQTLATRIPSAIPGTSIIGPHLATPSSVSDLAALQMQDCLEAGFLEALPPKAQVQGIAEAWTWLRTQNLFSTRQVFVVLVDLDSSLGLTEMASIFSRVRYLETTWKTTGARLLFIIAGSWNSSALAEQYGRNGVSFPYTIGHNYMTWTGIDPEAMVALAKQIITKAMAFHGQVLFELTGGNPAVAEEVLSELAGTPPSVKQLVDATYRVALNGRAGKRWLASWSSLPLQAQEVVRQILRRRYVSDSSATPGVRQLLELGMVKQRQVGERRFLGFHSWYMELLLRSHLDTLDLGQNHLGRAQIHELIPTIFAANLEAFEIIHDVENNVRNFVTLWLCMHNPTEAHFLRGRAPRYIDQIDAEQDIYESAVGWRRKNTSAGFSADLNPLMAYCSTRDLAELVEEIARDSRSASLRQVAVQIRKLANVRDAVMHNQLIDDQQLLDLYTLQTTVFDALTQIQLS